MKLAEIALTQPFLKWVGGKRWLASRHAWLIPDKFKTYIEPFLGGGAMLFYLRPAKALVGDSNSRLVDAYKAVRRDPRAINRMLAEHQKMHSHEYYYRIREASYANAIAEAARFIYLNRACFNGIYRENLRGEFNVPKGNKTAIVMPDDDFESTARVLSRCEIVAQDFEVTLCSAKRGDFAFVDPPYTIKHNNNGFIKYNQKLFGWEDQLRLRECVEGAASRGVKVLLTNANHRSVRDLYRDIGSIHRLSRSSILSASSEYRKASTELAITIGYEAGEAVLPQGRGNACTETADH